MFAGFILNGYQPAIPELAPFANLTWFGWTINHLPLAGQFDWPSVGLLAVFVVVLLGDRRRRPSCGATSAPRARSRRRPFPEPSSACAGRVAGHRRAIPAALAWGIGIGVFGLVLAGSGRSFIDQLDKSPDFMDLLDQLFPGVDFASVGGFLELVFIEFGLILAGLAAATLVAGWASDETSGRLEMLLATPLQRRAGSSRAASDPRRDRRHRGARGRRHRHRGLMSGGDLVTPVVGTIALGLYAAALGGIGFAIGGVFSTAAAGAAIAILTAVIWLLDIVGPAFGLPPFVHDLALSAHYGQPMLGVWDPVGIVVSLMLAVGGVAIGAWGFARRDLQA